MFIAREVIVVKFILHQTLWLLIVTCTPKAGEQIFRSNMYALPLTGAPHDFWQCKLCSLLKKCDSKFGSMSHNVFSYQIPNLIKCSWERTWIRNMIVMDNFDENSLLISAMTSPCICILPMHEQWSKNESKVIIKSNTWLKIYVNIDNRIWLFFEVFRNYRAIRATPSRLTRNAHFPRFYID